MQWTQLNLYGIFSNDIVGNDREIRIVTYPLLNKRGWRPSIAFPVCERQIKNEFTKFLSQTIDNQCQFIIINPISSS